MNSISIDINWPNTYNYNMDTNTKVEKKAFLFFYRLLIALGLVFVFNQYILVAEAESIKVFMVQSYSEKDLCGVPQLKGAIDILRENIDRNKLKIDTFFMKTKTEYTTKKEIDKIANIVYKKIIETKPDLVMLFDDAAFMELAPRLIKTRFKVVFSGINRPLEEYNKTMHFMNHNRIPTKNITGVYEKLHICDSINFIENIIDKTGKIALISSSDIIGRIVKKQIYLEIQNTKFQDSVIFMNADNTDNLIKALKYINKKKDIIAYILNTESINDKNGKKLSLLNTIPIAVKYAQKPDIALNALFCQKGLFGGSSVNPYEMGRQAGYLAVKLLTGVSARKLTIEDADKTDRVVNIKRAKSLNIKIPVYILNSLDAIY